MPLLSDPFGRGWDIFGSADYRPDLAILTPQRSGTCRRPRSSRATSSASPSPTTGPSRSSPSGRALRSQYAMLALMVLYTVGGLLILSRS